MVDRTAENTQDSPFSWEALKHAIWQLAEGGLGPLSGAQAVVAKIRRRAPKATPEEHIRLLVRGEGRKQFTAALALAAISSVVLPAGLPASLAAAYLLDARLALSMAILLGHSLEAPGVREALEEALKRPALPASGRGTGPEGDPARASRDSGPGQNSAATLANVRLLVEYAAPKVLSQSRRLLSRYASSRWQRRLFPMVRALPAAGQIAVAAFEARAMRGLAERVRLGLARLPTEAVRSRAVTQPGPVA